MTNQDDTQVHPPVDATSGFKASPSTSNAVDDDAYLLAMVEGTGDDGTESSLLPSVMNFSGFLDDATQLNAEELSDIAGLLAPPVSDDDEEEEQAVSTTTTEVAPMNKQTTQEPVYVSSSEASTPTGDRSPTLLATAQAVIDNTEIPTLPELTKSIAAVSNKVTLAPKRPLGGSTTSTSSSSNKKAKVEPSVVVEISNPVLPVPSATPELVPSSSSTAAASDKPATTMTAEACTSTSVSPTTVVSSSTTSPSVPKQTITAEEAAAEAKTKAITEQATAAAAAAASNTPAQVTLSEEARAQQCRDRNRQHARNTRLRKKAYIEELKRNLRDMVDQRDRELQAESHKALVEKQQREVRFQVMQDFLQLRGRNEANPHRWAAILTDGFTLTLPVTRFQDMVATSPDGNNSQPPREQVLTGVDQIMQDSTYFAAFLQSLGNTNTTTPTSTNDDTHVDTNNMATTTTFTYHCHRSNFLMDGCTSILSWTATSNGATSKGASSELEMAGSMRATFCPQTNRLAKVDIQFDTGVAHKQIGH